MTTFEELVPELWRAKLILLANAEGYVTVIPVGLPRLGNRPCTADEAKQAVGITNRSLCLYNWSQ